MVPIIGCAIHLCYHNRLHDLKLLRHLSIAGLQSFTMPTMWSIELEEYILLPAMRCNNRRETLRYQGQQNARQR